MRRFPLKRGSTRLLLEQVHAHRAVLLVILFLFILSSAFDGLSIGLLVPLLGSLQGLASGDLSPTFARWMPSALADAPVRWQAMVAVLLVIFAITLKNATGVLAAWLGARLSTQIAAELRTSVIRVLMSAGLSFHRRKRLGETIAIANEFPIQVQDLVFHLVNILALVTTSTVLVGLLFVLSWQLTLVAIALGTVCLILLRRYVRGLARASKTYIDLRLETNHRIQEALGGIQLIQAYTREAQIRSILEELIDRSRHVHATIVFQSTTVGFITDVLGASAIGALLFCAAFLFEPDRGQLVARLLPFMYVITRLVPLARLINLRRTKIVSDLPALDRLHEILHVEDKRFLVDGTQPFHRLERGLSLHKVSFAYAPGATFALRDLDLEIEKGSTTAIVGRSGSGKSTLVDLLLRFHDPDEGEIRIDGMPLADLRLASYRQKIGIVGQETFLFHDTVRNNIAFGLEGPVSDEQIIAAARRAGAHEFIEALARGYDTIIGDRGMQLSGGQRQRLAIARAMLRDPEILVLDEATSSLDNRTEQAIHHAIMDFGRDRTLLIIAHRLSTVAQADRIVVLREGRIVEIGRREELIAADGEFSRLARQESLGEPEAE